MGVHVMDALHHAQPHAYTATRHDLRHGTALPYGAAWESCQSPSPPPQVRASVIVDIALAQVAADWEWCPHGVNGYDPL